MQRAQCFPEAASVSNDNFVLGLDIRHWTLLLYTQPGADVEIGQVQRWLVRIYNSIMSANTITNGLQLEHSLM